VAGEVGVWADALHEGPVPAGIEGSAFRELRARWAARAKLATLEEAMRLHEAWEQAMVAALDADEPVLWLEHDLFDQLLLLHHLHRFRRAGDPAAPSLICIGEFEDVDPFHGLGQLSPAQLASLFPARTQVTGDMLEHAADAWQAFTGDDPRALEPFAAADAPGLPHLRHALHRLLAEYPAVRDGLARTERQILQVVAVGADSPGSAFRAVQEFEEAQFLGDAVFWSIAHRLATGPRRLLRIEDETPRAGTLPQARLAITEHGRGVLAGREDAVRMRGIDRWIGGVRLKGAEAAWRWDGAKGRVVGVRG
jgi:hypothetical protein